MGCQERYRHGSKTQRPTRKTLKAKQDPKIESSLLMFTLWQVLFGNGKIGKNLFVKGIKYGGIFAATAFVQAKKKLE